MSDHPAWYAYVQAIRELHQAAGSPSSRTIADIAGSGLSHATANDTVSGRRLPSWAIVARVVSALGANPLEFHPTWKAAHDELHPPSPVPRPPVRGRQVSPVEWEILQQLSEIRAMLLRLAERS